MKLKDSKYKNQLPKKMKAGLGISNDFFARMKTHNDLIDKISNIEIDEPHEKLNTTELQNIIIKWRQYCPAGLIKEICQNFCTPKKIEVDGEKIERFLKSYKEIECIDDYYLERLAKAIKQELEGE